MKSIRNVITSIIVLSFLVSLCMTSCTKNKENKNPSQNSETTVDDTAYLSEKVEFKNTDFKNIIAATLNVPADNLTYGDLKKIVGLDVYFYAERIGNTSQYKEVCSVTVKKEGFDEIFDLYYDTPEEERACLENPSDYSFNEQLFDFQGYDDIKLLTELKEISLSNEYMLMLSNPVPYFNNLTKLESVSLYNYAVPNLTEIGKLTNLTNLSIGINLRNIPDGVEIEYIKDLTPLKKLTKLKSLSFSGNIISDLSPLTSLDSLTDLTVANAALGDISPVAEMKKLENITLMYNGIEDVSPLVKIPGLKYINLDYNYIQDISPFANLNPDIIEYVSLDMNGIDDTTPLKHLGKDKVNFGYDPYWDYE